MNAAARSIGAAVWTAGALAVLAVLPSAQAAGDAAHGEQLYLSRCGACHSMDDNRAGPAHRGVFGRKAGSLDDFRYSPAMKRSGLTWSPQTLDAYVADPQTAVPQNRMPYAGMPEARDRADLIAYLKKASGSRPSTR